MTTTKVSNGPSLECDKCHVLTYSRADGLCATCCYESTRELRATEAAASLTDEQLRAEMHRRAEAAEAKACLCGCNAMREGPTHMSGAAMALMSPALWPFAEYFAALGNERPRFEAFDALKAEHAKSLESGHGIEAVRPDNSVAHLDEDLLADDA